MTNGSGHAIGFAPATDGPALMEFIGEHYRSGHVLSRSRALFDWQYLDGAADRYRFVTAVRTDSAGRRGELLGILGYITTQQYDPDLQSANCLWLALWQVRADAGIPALGLKLMSFLRENVPHAHVAVAGINPALVPVYTALGFDVEYFDQFYVVNPHVERRRIGAFAPEPPVSDGSASPLTLSEATPRDVETIDTAEPLAPDQVPIKSARYFQHRYLDHPFYDYRVYAAYENDAVRGLIAGRVVEVDGARAFRVVDALLSPAELPALAGPLTDLVVEQGWEYADLVYRGPAGPQMTGQGFSRLEPGGSTIVPMYFEPFERQNRQIRVCFRGPDADRFSAFKADGDQDRPNQL